EILRASLIPYKSHFIGQHRIFTVLPKWEIVKRKAWLIFGQGALFTGSYSMPATASTARRIRFNASERPDGSNHSRNVCAPPPVPPPPTVTASSPIEIGMFASVEARRSCEA